MSNKPLAWKLVSPGGSAILSIHENDAKDCKSRGWTVVPLHERPEDTKLVQYFNGDGYQEYGWHGDERGLSPAETAIYFLRERATLGKKKRAPK